MSAGAFSRFGDFPARITLAAVAMALGVGAILTVTTIVRERHSARAVLDARGLEMVSALAQNAELGVLAGDRPPVEAAARAVLERLDVDRVIVFRRERPFVDLHRQASAPDPGPPPPPGEPRSIEDGPGYLVFTAPIVIEPSSAESNAFYSQAPQSEMIGTAEVILSLDRLRRSERSTVWVNALVLFVAIGAAVLASLVVARRIARPLLRLSGAAERVGAGALDVRLPVESSDAIGQLSNTFNRMVDALRAAEESKTKFLAVISHELRTPLVPLKGYLQLAARGALGPLPPGMQGPLSAMQRSLDRLTSNVDALLLYSLIESDELVLVRKPVDLCACVGEAVERLRPRLPERSLTLVSGACPSPVWVLGDRPKLVQVVENLLSNAYKFSPRGGAIGVAVRVESGRVWLEVRDQGPGIPPELQARIFERFYQVHAAITRPYPGVGLGLAIVLELVHRQGGRVELESKPGAGSTFKVTLPLMQPPTA